MGDYGRGARHQTGAAPQRIRRGKHRARQAQREIDFWWTLELNRRSEAAYRRRRPDEIPERGEYSPIARYERETSRR